MEIVIGIFIGLFLGVGGLLVIAAAMNSSQISERERAETRDQLGYTDAQYNAMADQILEKLHQDRQQIKKLGQDRG